MSKLNELIQFADHLGQGKKEERRYQDQRAMQMAQIGEQKVKEQKIVQSQRFLNDAVKSFSETGWNEDGTYTNKSPNKTEAIDGYLANMDSTGQAGDRFMINQQLSQVNSSTLMADAQKLTGKVAQWESANADRKGDWFGSYDKDKKAYLKQIGADKLYASLHGLGGPAKAMEMTGLAPDSFDKKDDSWLQTAKDHPVLAGIGGVGTVIASGVALKYGGPKAAKAVQGLFKSVAKGKKVAPETVKGLLPSVEALAKTNPEAAHIMNKIIKAQGGGDTKKAIKILNRFQKKFPELNVLDDIVKGPGLPKHVPSKSILAKTKKFLTSGAGGTLVAGSVGYAAAEKLFSSMGDAITGKENSKTGQVGGVVGRTAGAYAVPSMLKKVGSKINEKGASWALKKVMEKGGPKLAAKFALKAGLAGFGTVASSGWGVAGAAAFVAADLYAISQILSEDD